MAAPREGDLSTFIYHHTTVSLPANSPAMVAGTPIAYNGTPVVLPATPVFGTTEFDKPAGAGDMTISLAGIVQVFSGGAIAVGDAISFDATSRAVPAAASTQIFGRALNPATAAGQRIRLLITRGVGN